MEEIEEFKKIFWDAFHRPKLESEIFIQVFQKLEPVNEMLAGPFYAIYSEGNCDYIFKDKKRFPGINDADDFLDYCTIHVHDYHDVVSSVEPKNDSEKKDKQILLYQTDTKMELARMAYEIQKKRINSH